MPTTAELRAVLDDAGVTFADCIAAFAAPADDPIVAAARSLHNKEGHVEVATPGITHWGGDAGTHVMAWVWVGVEHIDGDSCTMPLDLGPAP